MSDGVSRPHAGDYLESAVLLAVMEEDEEDALRQMRGLPLASLQEFRLTTATLLSLIDAELRRRQARRGTRG